jgi:uncharacterized membrane protein
MPSAISYVIGRRPAMIESIVATGISPSRANSSTDNPWDSMHSSKCWPGWIAQCGVHRFADVFIFASPITFCLDGVIIVDLHVRRMKKSWHHGGNARSIIFNASKAFMNEQRIHQVFEISILFKGAHALIECIGGAVLAFVSTERIKAMVNAFTQTELIENRSDFIALHLLGFAQHFSVSSQHFYAFYLLSHGLTKAILVACLLRNKLWAYPASLYVLGLFIAYQLYRYSYTQSVGLIALTVFDAFVMTLIWHEYRLILKHSSQD